jgi:hypothetical protein
MNLYIDEVLAGIKEAMELHKQSSNIFEMKGGNLFPNVERQQMWQYAKAPGHIHFTDGNSTYSFKGDVGDEDTELDKIPDVPLPDIFTNATSKGKAQVHRADPGSIYFTLQEGTKNPTYTFRHTGDSKWKAIPKKKKVKEQMAAPAYIPNVNAEQIKAGMLKHLEKEADGAQGGLLDFFNHAAGHAMTGIGNAAINAPLAIGRIGGAPGSDPLLNAGKAGLLGAGAGAAYHGIKRHFFNTPQENAQEDVEHPHAMLKRMLIPGIGLAGANLAERSLLGGDPANPNYNPNNYYQQAAEGHTPSLFDPPTE